MFSCMSIGDWSTEQGWDAEEEAAPKLFNFGGPRTSGSAVVNREDFLRQFNVSNPFVHERPYSLPKN